MNNKLYAILTPGNSNNGFVDKLYTNNPITLVMDNIFDYKQVRRMLDFHQSGKFNFGNQIYLLLVFELWRKGNAI